MGKYLKGNVEEELALGTLAANTVVGAIFDETMVDSGIITSIEGTWSLIDWTAGAGDGPLIVGVAHSDYSDAEILAVFQNTASWDFGNKIQREIAKRLVRIVGSFSSSDAGTFAQQVLNDGMPIKTKLNWRVREAQSLKLFCFNSGSSALADTAIVSINGHANIFYD